MEGYTLVVGVSFEAQQNKNCCNNVAEQQNFAATNSLIPCGACCCCRHAFFADHIRKLAVGVPATWQSDGCHIVNVDDESGAHVSLLGCAIHGGSGFDSFSVEDMLCDTLRGLEGVSGTEIWATVPTFVPLQSSPLQKLFCDVNNPQRAHTMMRELGMVCFPHVVSESKISELSQVTSSWIAKADDALQKNHPTINVGRDAFAFLELGSRGEFRFDLVVDERLPELSLISDLVRQGPWVEAVHHMLFPADPDAAMSCIPSIIYARPGAPDQAWHSDGRHLGAVCDHTGQGEENPYAVCVFLPLTAPSREAGFTQLWPGTHKTDKLVGFGPAAVVMGGVVDALVDSGSCVVYDYRLMHRGMGNFTQDVQRMLLQFVYHVPSYHEGKNYGNKSLFSL